MCQILWGQIIAAIAFLEPTGAWKVGEQVKTTSGVARGRPAQLADEVSEYLGIPYAAPPIGNLRWRPPQKFNGTGDIDATKWGPSCPAGGDSIADMDEDCLSINIWTKPQSGSPRKPVLFNLYGGGFNVGKSSTPYLNGAPLANREDVVVVSINYRLNVFGFPGAPGIENQNLGMLDIRAGMEWARDNVAGFGGDPEKITLFGESAGAGGADYYAYAWDKDPIANGFILQSGSAFTRGIAAKNNDKAWTRLARSVDCAREEGADKIVECMRKRDWKRIQRHIQSGPRIPLVEPRSFWKRTYTGQWSYIWASL
jgi:cholinesterase